MLGKKGPAAAVKGSALVSTGPGLHKTTAYQRKPDEKPSVLAILAKPAGRFMGNLRISKAK